MALKWFWQREDTAERGGDQQAESNILTADLLLSSIMNGEKITKTHRRSRGWWRCAGLRAARCPIGLR